MTEKRNRGRPAGTEINDDAAPARIADFLVASSQMKDSEAIRAVYMAGKYKGQSRRAIEERWRTKLSARRSALIEAATKRKATKEARPTSGGGAYPTSMGYGLSLASLRNPLHDASISGLNNALLGPVARAARGQVGYGPAGMYETMRRIDEQQRLHETMRRIDQQYETMRRIEAQQRLMDQIDMANRYLLWPYR